MTFFVSLLAVLLEFSGPFHQVLADPIKKRSHSYSGFNTGALGDIRTVGMGGATVGLADTFLASSSNPAGLAMTLANFDTNITRTQIQDGLIQDYNQPIGTSNSAGVALAIGQWGFSLGVVPIGAEGATERKIEAKEYKVGAARAFLDGKLSLGVTLNFGVGGEELFDEEKHGSAIGLTGGVLYQFPERVLLGLSYTSAMHYDMGDVQARDASNFFQPIEVPSRLAAGVGWIPNYWIRCAFQLSLIGISPNTALLADDSRQLGSDLSMQPKLGVAYIFMDSQIYRGTFFAGTYLETPRIENSINRFHKTTGAEFRAWIFTAGVGFDIAPDYLNYTYSVGVDLGKVLEHVKLIPVASHPPYRGFLPNPFFLSDQGLASSLAQEPRPSGPDLNPVEIVVKVPENSKKVGKVLQKDYQEIKKAIESTGINLKKK